MAIVTWPLSSGEARGRVGDLIYNTHRGTSYVKTHVVHQSEFTQPQIDVRAATAVCTAQWQSLDNTSRLAWNHFALEHLLHHWTGQQKRISGYNWFIKLNFFAAWSGFPTHDIPPPFLISYTFSGLSALFGSSLIELTWTSQPIPGDDQLAVICRLEGPHHQGIQPSIKRAGTFSPNLESSGNAIFRPTIPAFYTLHIWCCSPIYGSTIPTQITGEVT